MIKGIIIIAVSFGFRLINTEYVQQIAPNDQNFIGLLNIVFFGLFLVGLYYLIIGYVKHENNKLKQPKNNVPDIDYDILSEMPQSLKESYLWELYKEQNFKELN